MKERRRALGDTAAACTMLSSYKSGMADFAFRRVLARVEPMLLETPAHSPEEYDPWGVTSLSEILEQCLEEAICEFRLTACESEGRHRVSRILVRIDSNFGTR